MWWTLAQESEPTSKWADTVDTLARTPLSKVVFFILLFTIVRVLLAPMALRHAKKGAFVVTSRRISDLFDAFVYAGIIVFLLVRPFVVQVFTIPSGSMIPTLLIGDFIAANKAVYRYSDPQDGDIVVFRPPAIACMPEQIDPADGSVKVDFVKRCIGTPGEYIEVRDGMLYRNGKRAAEPYLKEICDHDFKLVRYNDQYWPILMTGQLVNSDSATANKFRVEDTSKMDKLRNLPPASIPPGYYLMMGDNRNNSFDGRSWGLVPREAIIGRAEFIWLPISRWRRTR